MRIGLDGGNVFAVHHVIVRVGASALLPNGWPSSSRNGKCRNASAPAGQGFFNRKCVAVAASR